MGLRSRTLLVLAAALALLSVPAVANAQNPTLRGTVGSATNPDAFVITLQHEDGRAVTQLDPGTYTIVVTDHSTMHNFHLTGPGVNQATSVEDTGTVTWTVTFTDGIYRFVCDPHPTEMRGSFRVGTPPPPTQVPTLVATVGPSATITLRNRFGAPVRRLTAGRYRIIVRDRSRIHNFRLRGPGISRSTGVRFRGTVTWTVTLRSGTYRYWCTPHARRMRGSFRVT